MTSFAVVLSGLPASGKTTLGRAIADALDLPYLDKDEFLECLFDSEGVGDGARRQQLSRQSDAAFQEAAEALDAAVLISHWRPRGGPDDTGTPTVWLGETYDTIVEVHCVCSPECAAQRFLARERHPGHLDTARDADQTVRRMRRLAEGYPLGLGELINVKAGGPIDQAAVIKFIKVWLANSELQ